MGDREVAVEVSLTSSRLRLESEGKEIGDWDRATCSVAPFDSDVYAIHAEGEALVFRPDVPEEFGQDLSDMWAATPGSHVILEGAPPKPITIVLFVLLLAATLAMGVWASAAVLS